MKRYALLDTDFISKTHSVQDDGGNHLIDTLNGTLYPDEQVVIYDIGDVKPEAEKKRRGRRKKSEIESWRAIKHEKILKKSL